MTASEGLLENMNSYELKSFLQALSPKMTHRCNTTCDMFIVLTKDISNIGSSNLLVYSIPCHIGTLLQHKEDGLSVEPDDNDGKHCNGENEDSYMWQRNLAAT